MTGEQRRKQLLELLAGSERPVSGTALAKRLGVSRQVIVQDIALLRANGTEIFSASRGYLIVDMGGRVRDVFIYHKVYGVVRADMNIRSRRDVSRFLETIVSGKSSLLKNVTAGYHYHTVLAEDEPTLDMIQEQLWKKGMLARLQDYEPVDFWNKSAQE